MKVYLMIVASLVLLAGCQSRIVPGPQQPSEKVAAWSSEEQSLLKEWIEHLEDALKLNEEQAQQQLKRLGRKKPTDMHGLYRYALLNQQLKDRLGWIRARDAYRKLSTLVDLPPSARPLVTMLQQHNQAMINAQARYGRLVEALEQQQQQQAQLTGQLQQQSERSEELAKKIKALTQLEQSMNRRRVRTVDSTAGNGTEGAANNASGEVN